MEEFNFIKQLVFKPEFIDKNNLNNNKQEYLLCGMGGSQLVGLLINDWHPSIKLEIHNDYNLPRNITNKTIIINSHSGNTEETISALKEALSRKLSIAIISGGGLIWQLAEENKLPRIKISNKKFPARFSIIYHLKALLEIINLKDLQIESENILNLKKRENDFIQELENKIPIIYSSSRNKFLNYFWKVQLNETAKMPAFGNLIPEANHNELAAFGYKDNKDLLNFFYFIFLEDPRDSFEILKRFDSLSNYLEKLNYPVKRIELQGDSRIIKIINNLNLAANTSLSLAKLKKEPSFETPVIENFKKIMLN